MMKVSILTENFKSISSLGTLKEAIQHFFFTKKISGHHSVTRSLLTGLKQLNINYNYNSTFSFLLNKTVIVLSDVNALKSVIKEKELGKINTIIAGPNLMVRSNEYDEILGNKYIDKIIVPSEWVKSAYIEDLPSIKKKLVVWASGIDSNYFTPTSNPQKKQIIIYWKSQTLEFIKEIEQTILQLDYEITIIKYGSYTITDFKTILNNSIALIYISDSESQGLAIQECWSMNVPTFVWQPRKLIIGEKEYNDFSSAPYLTTNTGLFFYELNELKKHVEDLKNNDLIFTPREEVLNNLTDKISAQNLLKIINN